MKTLTYNDNSALKASIVTEAMKPKNKRRDLFHIGENAGIPKWLLYVADAIESDGGHVYGDITFAYKFFSTINVGVDLEELKKQFLYYILSDTDIGIMHICEFADIRFYAQKVKVLFEQGAGENDFQSIVEVGRKDGWAGCDSGAAFSFLVCSVGKGAIDNFVGSAYCLCKHAFKIHQSMRSKDITQGEAIAEKYYTGKVTTFLLERINTFVKT